MSAPASSTTRPAPAPASATASTASLAVLAAARPARLGRLRRLDDKGQFAAEQVGALPVRGRAAASCDGLVTTLKAFALAAVLSLVAGRAARRRPALRPRRCAGSATARRRVLPRHPAADHDLRSLYVGDLLSRATRCCALVIGLILYNGSVHAEIVRAGINAVPAGQREAAYALGMRKTQVMTTVLVPQAVRAMLPAIISQLVVTLKDTSLGYVITYRNCSTPATSSRSNSAGFPFIPLIIIVATCSTSPMCLAAERAAPTGSRHGAAAAAADRARRRRRLRGGHGRWTAAGGVTVRPR